MIVALIGCGNVGANLLHYIVDLPGIEKILAVNRTEAHLKAAIMDVAGYKPRHARKIVGSSEKQALGQADLVVITAGIKGKEGDTPRDVLQENIRIHRSCFEDARLKPEAIVITISGPVDRITSSVAEMTGLPCEQVIGFGGDLDFNRLIYALEDEGIESTAAAVVGEHGPRAIPVYTPEISYESMAYRVRHFLAAIGKAAGHKRNLATAPLLARLVESIAGNSQNVHCISGYHNDYGMYLTWPFRVGRGGIQGPESIELPQRAKVDFERLLEKKRSEAEMEGSNEANR